MMAPPNTFAPAAVSPSSKLVRMGDMRRKNIRLRLVSCGDAATPVSTRRASHERNARLLRFWRRANSGRREFHAPMVTTHRMARLRHLFDHPRLLADDPSVCRAVARPASFLSPLAIYGAVARMGRDVARRGVGHAAVAGWITVSSGLDLGHGDCAVPLRAVGLFAIREEFQPEATRRPARSSWRKSRSAPGDGWNPGASAASCVPGAPVRDAGMERGHRPRGVLGA